MEKDLLQTLSIAFITRSLFVVLMLQSIVLERPDASLSGDSSLPPVSRWSAVRSKVQLPPPLRSRFLVVILHEFPEEQRCTFSTFHTLAAKLCAVERDC